MKHARALPLFLLVPVAFASAIAACDAGDDTVAPNYRTDSGGGGGSDDVTTTTDGTPTQPLPDTGATPDTTPPGPRILCGQQLTCTPGSEDCCLGGAGATCKPTGTCPGSSLACSGAASCNSGETCCGTTSLFDGGLADGGNATKIVATCTSGATCAAGKVQLCDQSTECTGGLECRRSSGGARECRPPLDGGGGEGGNDAGATDTGTGMDSASDADDSG
jgi:hypothetical protein